MLLAQDIHAKFGGGGHIDLESKRTIVWISKAKGFGDLTIERSYFAVSAVVKILYRVHIYA